MSEFTFKLLKTTKFKSVSIELYQSTLGYFVETSQGIISDYFKTKKEAADYVKITKSVIKIENNL